MKKTKRIRLTLNRETLRQLNEPGMRCAAAGALSEVRHCTVPFTDWPTCDPIT